MINLTKKMLTLTIAASVIAPTFARAQFAKLEKEHVKVEALLNNGTDVASIQKNIEIIKEEILRAQQTRAVLNVITGTGVAFALLGLRPTVWKPFKGVGSPKQFAVGMGVTGMGSYSMIINEANYRTWLDHLDRKSAQLEAAQKALEANK